MDYYIFYCRLMGAIIGIFVAWCLLYCLKLIICNKNAARRPAPLGIPHTESRARLIQSTQELPTCVSHFNLPALPKYELVDAPPSYDEVVGVHRPNYQAQQPIAQPIASALQQPAQPSSTAQVISTRNNDSVTRHHDNDIVVTINERATDREPPSSYFI